MLPSAQLAINNRDYASLGLSPFYFEHGYHVDPVEKVPPINEKSLTPPIKRAHTFVARIREAQEYAETAIAMAQQLMEENAN